MWYFFVKKFLNVRSGPKNIFSFSRDDVDDDDATFTPDKNAQKHDARSEKKMSPWSILSFPIPPKSSSSFFSFVLNCLLTCWGGGEVVISSPHQCRHDPTTSLRRAKMDGLSCFPCFLIALSRK